MKNPISSFAPSSTVAAALIASAALAVAALFSPLASVLLGVGLGVFILALITDLLLLLSDPAQAAVRETEQSFNLGRLKPATVTFAAQQSKGRFGRIERMAIQIHEGFREKRIALEGKLDAHWQTFSFNLLPVTRGHSLISEIHFSGRSPLGLWRYRHAAKLAWRFAVYPNLRSEGRNVAAFLARRDLTGMTTRRMMGMGREFDRLREYQPGDSYSEIYWKATARRQVPITMVKQIERTQQVYAIVDASRASRRIVDIASTPGRNESLPVSALDRYVNGALSLALAAQSQSDLFGMVSFSRAPELFLRAGTGTAHFMALQNTLLDLSPKEDYPNYEELFSQVRTRIRSRSLLVVFTHFDDASLLESFLDAAKLVARQHLVLAVSILPEHARPIFDSGNVDSIGDVYDRFAGHAEWKRLRDAEVRLSAIGIKLLLSTQENLCSQVVTRYLRVKERQLV